MADHTYSPIEIQLTQGKVALVSIEDADLDSVNWCASRDRQEGRFYAHRAVTIAPNRQRKVKMHRVILSRILGRPLGRGEKVDHVDRDGLNNTRVNLRLATHTQNTWNACKPKTNTSGYKGVSWHKGANRWQASICANGKSIWLGRFDTPEAAYEAYCVAARELHGEFARLE